jgi:hypothetical protein
MYAALGSLLTPTSSNSMRTALNMLN